MRTYKPKKPHPLFDELIRTAGLRNDAELARQLDVGRDSICRVRAGHPMSDQMRVRIMRNFNMSMRRLDELSPPDQWSPK